MLNPLFACRPNVEGPPDRYANIDAAYLTQTLGNYHVLTILATNWRVNIDYRSVGHPQPR